MAARGTRRAPLDRANLRRVSTLSALGVTALQGVTAVRAIRDTRRDYADAIWGPGLALIALTGAVAGHGDARRRWALAGITSAWALRLERQMAKRMKGDEEDPRYSEFLGDVGPLAVVLKVFVTQGVSQMVVSAPLQLAAASDLPDSRRAGLVRVGLAVMIVGSVTEALADRQKDAYSQRPKDERPDVLDTGLWGISRHPNYLGDSLLWDGVWLAAAASPPALVTLPAPVLMSYLLMFATGAKRTEKRMEDRPGYRDYQQRVAFFFPDPRKLARNAG